MSKANVWRLNVIKIIFLNYYFTRKSCFSKLICGWCKKKKKNSRLSPRSSWLEVYIYFKSLIRKAFIYSLRTIQFVNWIFKYIFKTLYLYMYHQFRIIESSYRVVCLCHNSVISFGWFARFIDKGKCREFKVISCSSVIWKRARKWAIWKRFSKNMANYWSAISWRTMDLFTTQTRTMQEKRLQI